MGAVASQVRQEILQGDKEKKKKLLTKSQFRKK